MKSTTFRKWSWVHTWSSLLCTIFLLVVCVTGLPLIFKDEIVALFDDGIPASDLPADTPNLSLDGFVLASRNMYPGQVIISIYFDDDAPWAVVTLAPSWKDFEAGRRAAHWLRFDARTGNVLKQSQPAAEAGMSAMGIVREVHRSLFIGPQGELFMAGMAALFIIALVSGAVIYGPVMGKRRFGDVRRYRSARITWLDLHNMIGIITLVWAIGVGATGLMNDLAKPLLAAWQATDVASMLVAYKGETTPAGTELTSPQSALETAQAARPGMIVYSIVFPGGSSIGTPFHYLVWAHGSEPLTSHLVIPALVNARTGQLDAVITMPWFLQALQIARPLHFGDYGGMPMKVIWVLLDLTAIIILVSGLYLWFARRAGTARAVYSRTDADSAVTVVR